MSKIYSVEVMENGSVTTLYSGPNKKAAQAIFLGLKSDNKAWTETKIINKSSGCTFW